MSVLTLNAIMNLDASKFTSGLSSAQKSFSTAGKAISTGMKGLATVSAAVASGVVAIGTAAVATGTKLYNMAVDVAAAGDEIQKNSQKVGLSYEAYQKWDYAMQIAGTDMASCTNGLKTLTNKFDDAINGSSSAAETFERLGLSMEDIQGLSREDLFATVVSRLQNVTDETEKAALANDLFGKSGQNLLPLFNTSEEELADLMAEAEEYGMIMSDEAVDASADFDDALTKLKGTATGLKNALVGQLLPGLTKITDGLAALLKGDKTATEQIKQGAKDVISTVKTLVPQAMEILGTITEAIFEAGPEILQGLVDGLSQALPGVLSAVTTLFNTYLPQLVPQVLPILSQVLSTLITNIAQFLPGLLVTLISFIATELPNLVATILPAIVQMLDIILQALPGLITQIVPVLVEVFILLLDTLWTQVLPVLLANIGPILIAVVGALMDNLPVLLEGIMNCIESLSNVIMSDDVLGPLLSAIFELIGMIVAKTPEFTAQIIGIIFNILVEVVVLIIATIVQLIQDLSDMVADGIAAWAEILSPVSNWIKEHIIDPVKNFFTGLWDNLTNAAKNTWETIKNVWNVVASWYYNTIITPVVNFFTNMWSNLKNAAINAWNNIKNTFSVVSSWYYNSVIAPVQNFFTNMWNNLKTGASNAWAGIKNVFSTVASFFQSTFQNAWAKVKQVFSSGGAIFQGIASGIYESFKNIVNSLISGINSVIYTPFSKIKSAISTIKWINIAGVYPFSGLPNISIPSIPYLAKGGLITSPMYAMIGEQGTEAVLPLERDSKALDMIADRLKNDQDLSPIVEAIKQMKIYLDSGVLVGAVSDQMDSALGIRQVQVSRGVTV